MVTYSCLLGRLLFKLDSSFSSKLFFLKDQLGLSLIDLMLLQEETCTKLALFVLDSFISSKLLFLCRGKPERSSV